MSSDETQSALSRAYNLVEAGNYGEARAILEPILAANKNNADAWWIYAHAVNNPEEGREALENVVRIDPRYPGASELLTQAQERFPAKPKITSLVRPISVPEAPQHLPEIPAHPPVTPEPTPAQPIPVQPVRDTREQVPAAARAPRRSSLPLIAILVVIIIVAAVAILLLTQNGGTPPATATSVVAIASDTPLPILATAEVTSTSEVTATVSVSTAEVTTETVATLEPTQEQTLAPTEAVTAEIAAIVAPSEAATTEVPPTIAPTEILATTAPTLKPSEAATAEIAPTQAPSEVPTQVPPTEVPPTQVPTEPPTATPTQVPTEPPTATPTEASAQSAADSFAAIEQALSKFSLAESGVGEVSTSLGNTVMVTVCTTPGRAMRTLLPQAMNALAKVSPELGTSADAIGVRMLDCGGNTPLLTVAIDLPTAQSYAKGDLTDSAFAATWKPQ